MVAKSDVRVVDAMLYFLPVTTRIPLKFGSETTSHVTCARARLTVAGAGGRAAEGWGETPLSVAWMWPSAALAFTERGEALREFCRLVGAAFAAFPAAGHALEIGHLFTAGVLPRLLDDFNRRRHPAEPLPWLAALGCFSPFDIALHDAYAVRLEKPVYRIYSPEYMNRDLSWFYGSGGSGLFAGKYPGAFLPPRVGTSLPAWHMVGGRDLLSADELAGYEPDDGYPVVLADWIRRDGLFCLKVKLSGTDPEWDYRRLSRVWAIGSENGAPCLCADFNCQAPDPGYVIAILDRIEKDRPGLWKSLLYLEQPFPYDLEKHRIDVHGLAARKPLFLDESAHGWRQVALGRELGWTGVALKTCKTQTGAILSLCWAKAHGMGLMVQDLTNPMLAQIAHLQLAAHAGTIMGVETNAMQFYPGASLPEAAVHPGAYARVRGRVCLESFGRTGFGYRLEEINRALPPPETLGG